MFLSRLLCALLFVACLFCLCWPKKKKVKNIDSPIKSTDLPYFLIQRMWLLARNNAMSPASFYLESMTDIVKMISLERMVSTNFLKFSEFTQLFHPKIIYVAF